MQTHRAKLFRTTNRCGMRRGRISIKRIVWKPTSILNKRILLCKRICIKWARLKNRKQTMITKSRLLLGIATGPISQSPMARQITQHGASTYQSSQSGQSSGRISHSQSRFRTVWLVSPSTLQTQLSLLEAQWMERSICGTFPKRTSKSLWARSTSTSTEKLSRD